MEREETERMGGRKRLLTHGGVESGQTQTLMSIHLLTVCTQNMVMQTCKELTILYSELTHTKKYIGWWVVGIAKRNATLNTKVTWEGSAQR